MTNRADLRVELQFKLLLEEGEAVGADVEHPTPVLFWEGTVVAYLHDLVSSILEELNCFQF